eukprot:6199168-Pleurochrysis_carterae.AAC.1
MLANLLLPVPTGSVVQGENADRPACMEVEVNAEMHACTPFLCVRRSLRIRYSCMRGCGERCRGPSMGVRESKGQEGRVERVLRWQRGGAGAEKGAKGLR